MKKLTFSLLFLLITTFSCVEMSKDDCIEGYAAADKWFFEQTKGAGNNQNAKDRIYLQYLDKYKELDLKCK
jgi:hypothetical protein